jgi:hypothetical protein
MQALDSAPGQGTRITLSFPKTGAAILAEAV